MYNYFIEFQNKNFLSSSIHLMMKMVNATKWYRPVQFHRLSHRRSYSLIKVSQEELIVAVASRKIDMLDDYQSLWYRLFSDHHWPDHSTPCSRSAEIKILYCVWIVCRICMILIVCTIYIHCTAFVCTYLFCHLEFIFIEISTVDEFQNIWIYPIPNRWTVECMLVVLKFFPLYEFSVYYLCYRVYIFLKFKSNDIIHID